MMLPLVLQDIKINPARCNGNRDDIERIIPEDRARQVVAGIFDRHR